MASSRQVRPGAYGGVYFVWMPDLGHPWHHVNFILSAAVVASGGQDLMPSVETGQMSAVETGQMSAAETGQMSFIARTDICLVSTHNVQVSTVAVSQW